MCSVVLAHVDELASLCHSVEGCLYNGFRFAHEGHHRTVGSLTRVNVKQFHTFHSLYGVGNLLDNIQIAAFTEIWHALDNLSFLCHTLICFFSIMGL